MSVRAEKASPEDLQLKGARRFPAVEKLLPENAKERAGFSKNVNAHRRRADCAGILRDTAQWL